MATLAQINLLKVLACMAWADGEFSNAELNFIKRLARQMDLSADEWLQLEMYMDEKVEEEEALRMTKRFVTQIHRPGQRRKLTETVTHLLRSDEVLSNKEREWLQDFERVVADTSQASFLLDGLKSFLRVGASSHSAAPGGREAEFYDFIHNRVLFRLRRRVGSQQLERVGRPEKLKKITLSAAFLAKVGYVKDDRDLQETEVIQKILRAMWDVSEPMARAITNVATESASKGLDLYRVMEESKVTLSLPERKGLLQGLFAVARAGGKASSEEIEEIRSIAYGLGFSHREFINAKLKAMEKGRR